MEKNIFKNPLFIAICATFCCALWGSATPFIKIGYKLALPVKDVPSTLLFAGLRFCLAGILTIAFVSITNKKFLYPKKSNILKVLNVSCFQTVIQYIFFYIGLANTSGVKGTVLSGSNAFFALLIASTLFRYEKFTLRKIIACILGFSGIVLVNINGLDFTMNFTGDCFVIFSSVAYGVSSCLIKKYSNCENPVVISGYQFFIGGFVMAVTGVLTGGIIEISSLLGLLVLIYLGFLSAIAYGLWSVLLKHNPVSKVTIYSFLIPVFGVILSNVMLTEKSNVSSVNLIITLILICTGVIMLNYSKNKEK